MSQLSEIQIKQSIYQHHKEKLIGGFTMHNSFSLEIILALIGKF
jgi:hypothetical protein